MVEGNQKLFQGQEGLLDVMAGHDGGALVKNTVRQLSQDRFLVRVILGNTVLRLFVDGHHAWCQQASGNSQLYAVQMNTYLNIETKSPLVSIIGITIQSQMPVQDNNCPIIQPHEPEMVCHPLLLMFLLLLCQ